MPTTLDAPDVLRNDHRVTGEQRNFIRLDSPERQDG